MAPLMQGKKPSCRISSAGEAPWQLCCMAGAHLQQSQPLRSCPHGLFPHTSQEPATVIIPKSSAQA